MCIKERGIMEGYYPLRVLFWEATLRCNAFCSFCGSSCNINLSANEELSQTEICNAFYEISQKADPKQIMIDVTGGEPLLRDDLFEIMKYASSLGFRWGIVTNGTLLSQETINKLKESQCKTISISLDGKKHIHDSIRGVLGGYEKIVEGIIELKKADFLDYIMVTTVVSRKNFDHLDELKEELIDLPIDIWRIVPVDPIGRALNIGEKLILSNEQRKDLYSYISILKQENLPFLISTSCSHYLGEYEFVVRDFPFSCMAGKTVGSILSNGDIYVCPNVERKKDLIQGNVKNSNFIDIWNNQFGFFRDSLMRKKGDCYKCDLFDKCQGDSLHTWDLDNNVAKVCVKHWQKLENKKEMYTEIKSFTDIIDDCKKKYGIISGMMVEAQSLTKDKVLFYPEATKKILEYFQWGRERKSKEMVCMLIGKIFKESDCVEIYNAVVTSVFELSPLYASEDLLFLSKNLFSEIETVIQKNKELIGTGEVIGFIHSHPNEALVAMSLSDYKWHRSLYTTDWKKALTVIINPQTKQIAAYSGPAANHSELHLLQVKND